MVIDRILKIIELKGITKHKFYSETGLSNGFLDKVKDIGSSKIENILKVYPDINPTWLITGNGEMLKNEKELKEWSNNSIISDDHIIWELVDNYQKNTPEIDYFFNKIKTTCQILKNLDNDYSKSWDYMLEVLEKNINNTKEMYFFLFSVLGIRQEMITNIHLIEDNNLKEKLDNHSYEDLEKQCKNLINDSVQLKERVKTIFDDVFNILLKYSELK